MNSLNTLSTRSLIALCEATGFLPGTRSEMVQWLNQVDLLILERIAKRLKATR